MEHKKFYTRIEFQVNFTNLKKVYFSSKIINKTLKIQQGEANMIA